MNRLKQIHHPVAKLLFTVGYLALVLLLFKLGFRCFFLTILHLPCPGCGMSRAMLSVLRLDLISAFGYHGMFWSMPILYLYFLFDGKLFKNPIVNKTVFILIAVGFGIVWLFAIINHLS